MQKGARNRKSGFAQILCGMWNDRDLSMKAKSVVTFCACRPDDWKFSSAQIASDLGIGIKVVYSAINECVEKGYAYRYSYKENNLLREEVILCDSKEDILCIIERFEKHDDTPDVDSDQIGQNGRVEQDSCEQDEVPQIEYDRLGHFGPVGQNDCEPDEHIDIDCDQLGQNGRPGRNTSNERVECPHNDFHRLGHFGRPNNIEKSIQEETTTEGPGIAAVFSHTEFQEEEASEVEKTKEPKDPEIWPVLETVSIPDRDKCWITKTYPEEVVINAVAWALHPKSTQFDKPLAAKIKYACKEGLKVEKSAKEIAEEEASDKQKQRAERIAKHRALALSYQGRDLGGLRVTVGQDMVQIRHPNQRKVSVLFHEEGFPAMIEREIKSFVANQVGASTQRSDNLCYLNEKPNNIQHSNDPITKSLDNHDKIEKEETIEKLSNGSKIIFNKCQERMRLMEENRSYADTYHKQAYGNIVVYVFPTYIAFTDVTANEAEAPLDFLPLFQENFKEQFKGCLRKHNFPLVDLGM
jgi:hypothetical protein